MWYIPGHIDTSLGVVFSAKASTYSQRPKGQDKDDAGKASRRDVRSPHARTGLVCLLRPRYLFRAEPLQDAALQRFAAAELTPLFVAGTVT